MAENINRRGFIQSGSTLAFASLLPAELLASIEDIPVSPFGFATTADEITAGIDLIGKTVLITGCKFGARLPVNEDHCCARGACAWSGADVGKSGERLRQR